MNLSPEKSASTFPETGRFGTNSSVSVFAAVSSALGSVFGSVFSSRFGSITIVSGSSFSSCAVSFSI